MTNTHQKELASELQRLLHLLGMQTSVYNIETREGMDGKAYIMECSPRGGGNRLSECLRYATGVDLITNAVRGALGEEIVGMEQRDYDGCWAEVVLHGDMPGVFGGIWTSKELENAIVERDLWVEEGDRIGGFSAANEAIGTLVLRFGSQQELQMVMDDIPSHVRVIVK
jgi:hypothetical protein